MPICPGCEQSVPYDRLDLHQRYCEGIWSDDLHRTRTVERFDQQLVDLELRLDRRLRKIETELERRLSKIEKARTTVGKSDRRE